MRARRLKIRGETWRIVIGRLPKTYADGVCDPNVRTIYISPHRDVDRKATVVHEILHACFEDIDESAITEAEEAICKGLELVG